ncbi:MAG: K+/H+ antiporter, partial [Clostridiales bacterium]|nr:K+/H+ antiporter [Clostridiales bacterium]
QGTLLPFVARKLDMVDESSDVYRTFNDYREETAFSLTSLHVSEGSRLAGRTISELGIPEGFLAVMLRRGAQSIIAKGDTKVLAGDDIVLSTPSYEASAGELLTERDISEKDSWCGKTLGELNVPKNKLVVMVIRGNENITPNGKTRLLAGDKAVIYQHGQ